jgi:hypothetical protein
MPDKQSRTDRAEANFKRRESDTGGLTEHQAANQAILDKTARLRALRLAKEAADRLEAESSPQLMSRSAKTKSLTISFFNATWTVANPQFGSSAYVSPCNNSRPNFLMRDLSRDRLYAVIGNYSPDQGARFEVHFDLRSCGTGSANSVSRSRPVRSRCHRRTVAPELRGLRVISYPLC